MIETHPAQALKAHDGDTVTVLYRPTGETRLKVRLLGIDAPERGEAFYDRSRAMLARLMSFGNITLQWEAANKDHIDGFNRPLVWMWQGTTLIQNALVNAGMAAVWEPKGPTAYSEMLTRSQQLAEANHRGIWSRPSHRLCDIYHRPRPTRKPLR